MLVSGKVWCVKRETCEKGAMWTDWIPISFHTSRSANCGAFVSDPDVQDFEAPSCPYSFSAACYTSSSPAARTFFQELLWRKVSNSRVVPGNVVLDSRSRG